MTITGKTNSGKRESVEEWNEKLGHGDIYTTHVQQDEELKMLSLAIHRRPADGAAGRILRRPVDRSVRRILDIVPRPRRGRSVLALRSSRPSPIMVIAMDENKNAIYSFMGTNAAHTVVDPVELPAAQRRSRSARSRCCRTRPARRFWHSPSGKSGRRVITVDPNLRTMVVPDLASWQRRLDKLRDRQHHQGVDRGHFRAVRCRLPTSQSGGAGWPRDRASSSSPTAKTARPHSAAANRCQFPAAGCRWSTPSAPAILSTRRRWPNSIGSAG